MFGLPLAFAAPLVLAALAVLPAIWYLLRLTPPRPREVSFPPLRLILDLQAREETPARTPWWLLALRLLLAALIILAMAGPIWNPTPAGEGKSGPLLVLLDDAWPAAPAWTERVASARERIAAANREGRTTALVAMSDGGRDISPGDATRANERLRTLKPVPHVPDRLAVLPAVQRFLAANRSAEVVWIADGLEMGHAREFADGLAAAAGDTRVHVVMQDSSPMAIVSADNSAGALEVRLVRPDLRTPQTGTVRALDMKGLLVGEARFDFGRERETVARFELPIELRNDISRVEIADVHSAGAVSLLDERWKRRRVGFASGSTIDTAQPLLSPTYYLRRALAPFADVREVGPGRGDPVLKLLDDNLSVLVLADIGVVSGPAHEAVTRFVEDGGVLLRFAGTRLASSSDDLVPVRLRRGGRVLGGSLSWETPKQLAPFPPESPLAGLAVPKEVTVTRQVLAEPDASLPGKTWARLVDGTPLVTAERRGKGLIVLVHVTADTTWSNLPLSGLFVDLLRRVVAMAGEPGKADAGQGAESTAPTRVQTVSPTRTLDGFGALGPPPLTARPIPATFAGPPTAEFPPGFYGPPDALTAINTLSPSDRLEPATFDQSRFAMETLRRAEPLDLRPAVVAAAFLLLLADALLSLWLAGGFDRLKPRRRRRGAATAGLLLAAALGVTAVAPHRAEAQINPMEAALSTRLAYVITGDAQVDEASRLGLEAVSRALSNRTALSPGAPMGVDPARDELAFFPLIYWPIVATRPQPAAEAVTKIANFMRQGGTVLFDTRDAMTVRPGGPPTPEARWLRVLLAGVDVPELEPVPRDHVITKTFYLLDQFVGRTTVGQTWIEALPTVPADQSNRPARAGDSVSPIIITSNDLAAAWASDRSGNPLYPLIPGGHRQREMALRAGVNLVMYTLTGNYKADQVHVRDLLERLAH